MGHINDNGMIYAINYADDNYKAVQHLCTKTLYRFGKVDRVIEYGPTDINKSFKEENNVILSQKKGNGYWLWKPYFVKKTLDNINDGDFLLYVDSATIVLKDIEPLITYMKQNNIDILCFETPFLEINWTKEAIIKLHDNHPGKNFQIEATYFLLRKSDVSLRVINEWLETAKKKNLIDDSDISDPCIENRHDQSLFSLICRNNDIKPVASISDRYLYENICRYYDKYYTEGKAECWADIYYKKHTNDNLGWYIFCHHFGGRGIKLYYKIMKKYIKTLYIEFVSRKKLQEVRKI